MLIFGDPMGYLLTSGMVFDDNQRLTSNHYHALEMTFGGSKSFLDLVINSLKTQNNHIWRPHGVFIDLRHGFRWLSKIEVKSLPCTRNVFWGSKSFPYLVINCLKSKNDHIWRPQRVFIDLRHGFRWWWSKIEFKSLPCVRNVLWGSKSFLDLVINCSNPKIIISGVPKGYLLTSE